MPLETCVQVVPKRGFSSVFVVPRKAPGFCRLKNGIGSGTLSRFARIGPSEFLSSDCFVPLLKEIPLFSALIKEGEGVPEMGTKLLKALRGYRASNRGSTGL